MPNEARSGSSRTSMPVALSGDGSDLLCGLVASLSRHERLLLCLRYADGLEDDEIAALTRMTVADVRRAIEAVVARARDFVLRSSD